MVSTAILLIILACLLPLPPLPPHELLDGDELRADELRRGFPDVW